MEGIWDVVGVGSEACGRPIVVVVVWCGWFGVLWLEEMGDR